MFSVVTRSDFGGINSSTFIFEIKKVGAAPTFGADPVVFPIQL
jgi:hypothetical protein